MLNLYAYKQRLARIFDDDLETVQYKNVFDYLIIGLILLSTLELFLSTFEEIQHEYGTILHGIDIFTTLFFTIEVTLRIWCADLIDSRYRGFIGRLRYCTSFYGFVDFISTYTFCLGFFLPINYLAFKSLRLMRVVRVFRLLRIMRYTRSIRLMRRALGHCRTELVVSLQFLIIITVILSFLLFFVEHDAQPEVYSNGWMSVAWAFVQYVGDPGGFAATPPITLMGQIIAFIIGILGVAIFAIPAGLVGGAFSDVMAEEQREEALRQNTQTLRKAFERKLDRLTKMQVVPRYITLLEAQARIGLKEDEIIEVATNSPHFRIINLSCTVPIERLIPDQLAIEHFSTNTSYGLCIDRGSKVTIFTPSNIVDPVMGWWGYYLAKIGGFNFVSRELGEARPYKSFYTYKPQSVEPSQQELMEDLNRLTARPNAWVFTILAAGGAGEPEYPTQFHFGYGAQKGDEGYTDAAITLHDTATFEAFYQAFATCMSERYNLFCDKHRYHASSSANIFARHLAHAINAVYMRISWNVTCWDMRAIQIAEELAKLINQYIEPEVNKELSPDLKVKDIGYDGYIN